ncbi:MAG: hypothetical protein KIT58_00090 [Planctomycetota bacterium]|nr:hypothetical protein [Planctomycetota bacterium]
MPSATSRADSLPALPDGSLDESPEALARLTPAQLAAWSALDDERQVLELMGWGADVAAFYEGCE